LRRRIAPTVRCVVGVRRPIHHPLHRKVGVLPVLPTAGASEGHSNRSAIRSARSSARVALLAGANTGFLAPDTPDHVPADQLIGDPPGEGRGSGPILLSVIEPSFCY
jgi:hypothetical protein